MTQQPHNLTTTQLVQTSLSLTLTLFIILLLIVTGQKAYLKV